MENLMDRITRDKEICNGKPVIRGLRITVSTILELLLFGTPEAEILKQYPDLDKADIEASRLFTLKMFRKNFSFRNSLN